MGKQNLLFRRQIIDANFFSRQSDLAAKKKQNENILDPFFQFWAFFAPTLRQLGIQILNEKEVLVKMFKDTLLRWI